MKENKVKQFLDEQFGEVGVVNIDNNLWFIANEIAKVLQYDKASDMTRNLDEDEKDTQSLLTLGGKQECLIINESGLYNAILSITKRNKERYKIAKDFKKWITNVVIPSIRKDGAYINGEEEYANGNLSEEEFVLEAMNILQRKVIRLKEENEILKPKANKWDKFIDTNGTYSFTEVAKLISTMANSEQKDIQITVMKLTDFLRQEGILSKAKTPDKENKKGSYKNLPNKDFEDYFNVVSVGTNGGFNKTQTRVNSKGIEYIYDLLSEKYNVIS